MKKIIMKNIYLIFVAMTVLMLAGCTDISGSGIADFGTTEADQEVMDHFTDKYGEVTQGGSPRIIEFLMTSNIVEKLPVDKVLTYSSGSDKQHVWFVYDNFEKGDDISIEWKYLETDKIIKTFNSQTGKDFGRGFFSLDILENMPDNKWPLGDYSIIIAGEGVSEKIFFSVIEGDTIITNLPWEEEDNPIVEEILEEDEFIGTTTQSGFIITSIDCLFIGDWNSNWGDMSFAQTGDNIVATYTHDQGRITGVMRGNVLVGTWSEAPSYAPTHDAGDMEIEISPDCKSFTGNWRYGSGGSWSGDWTGTKI